MKVKSLITANADRALAIGILVVAAVMLIVAWVGVSGKALAPEQLPYVISGGLGGIFLGAIGCTVWLSADLQDEWRRLDGIEQALSNLATATAAQAEAVTGAAKNGATTNGRRARATRSATKVSS